MLIGYASWDPVVWVYEIWVDHMMVACSIVFPGTDNLKFSFILGLLAKAFEAYRNVFGIEDTERRRRTISVLNIIT